MLGDRGEQTPLPSLVFCPLLLGGETWSSAPACIQEGCHQAPIPPSGRFLSPLPGGVFFIHESSQLQHGAALCEWVFVIDILIFYGTFSYEFGAVSSDTLVAALQPTPGRACKSSGSSSTSTHLNCSPESVAMI